MKYLLICFSLLFSACSVQNYERTQTKIVIIKSPKLRFADIGYLRNSDKAIELELFVAGNAVEKIQIDTLICIRAGCMSKSEFNASYLNHSYPDDILQNIFLGLEIYDGESKSQSADGFEQRIQNDDVDILYRVNSKEIFFKDRKNRIIFKIKDTNG